MNSGGGHRGRRCWQLVGVACAVSVAASVVYAVRQAWHGGLGPADLVTVLGFPLAVASLVGMLAGFRKFREGVEADLALGQARSLARLVAEGEGRVLTQLLGRDTARINLRYGLVPNPVRAASAPAAGLAVADPATGLPDIAAYYRATRPARLVITGAPGAGKTVLALQLLLDLIANRDDADPVPVRVPLAQWDTGTPLRDFLIQRLVDTFNLPRAVSGNLVAHGLILPMLDGLDEMDPTLPNGAPDPVAPRARAALDQLSVYQDAGATAPLVLTCRTAHYDVLAAADLLLDAARIAIAPVGSSSAVAYLAARARDLPRWQPTLDYLTAHQGSAHVALLFTPWRLCLTATVYHRAGDPAELLTYTGASDLDDHLLARYVAAATLAATDANPHGYTPQQIHYWLHQLATHLAPTPSTPARTDIALDKLWVMTGQARIRTAHTLLVTLIPLLPLFLVRVPAVPPALLGFGALGVGALVLMLGLPEGLAREATAGRLKLDLLTTPAGRADLAFGLKYVLLMGLLLGLVAFVMTGLVAGLVVSLMSGMATGQTAGLKTGLACGLAVWLGFGLSVATRGWLAGNQSSAAKPGRIIGEDIQLGLVMGLLAALMVYLMVGLMVGLRFGLAAGLACGLAAGLACGLAAALAAGDAAWRYLLFLTWARGRVPFRLARFLDWSCDTGLMRYSGPAYQFRHRELQLWLAAHPAPVD